MRVAIISDVHNNIINLQKVLIYCDENKIKIIICCGDLASAETLGFLADNFSGNIFHTLGNMDKDFLGFHVFDKEDTVHYENLKIFKNFGEAKINGKPVAFVHFPDKARELAESGKYDFVFYGHTHKPWIDSIEITSNQGRKECKILNPGNVANELYPPTFAVWNTKNNNFDLIRINDLE